MSLRRFTFAVVVATVALSTSARAQSTFTFNASQPNAVISGGYYVGPFNATLATTPGQATGLTIFCVDFMNDVWFGDTYQVNVTSIANLGGPLNDARHPLDIETYRKGAFLTSLFSQTSTNQWGGIQDAMWNLFTPAQAPVNAESPFYRQLADVASANSYNAFNYQGVNYSATNFANYALVTDVDAAGRSNGGHQEFITSNAPITATPEPGVFVLIATGLGGIVFVKRRLGRADR